jgi:rhodanese-related sulfurtransferase
MGDRVFTGDTLMIRGTGRTDFQNGDPYAQYDSIFNRLLTLPRDTMVFPGHDYKGDSVSTIGEERAFNPRLQVDDADQYAAIMNGLGLANPKMMDVAVPANCAIGAEQLGPETAELALDVASAKEQIARRAAILIDLREPAERQRDGEVPGGVHADYARLDELLADDGPLRVLSDSASADLVFISSYGERSMMATMLAREVGLKSARHIAQGIEAWRAG